MEDQTPQDQQPQPTEDELRAQMAARAQLPPTQFEMVPEGFQMRQVETGLGDMLAISAFTHGTPAIVATLFIPIESVDSFCELAKERAKPPSRVVMPDSLDPQKAAAAAMPDLNKLAQEAKARSGL